MLKVEVSINIKASPREVFALLADLPLLGRVHPYVVEITYVSVATRGVGVVSRWVVKKPDRPQVEFQERITAWEENRRIAFETLTHPKEIGELMLEATRTGTRVRFWEAIPDGLKQDPQAKKASMMAQLQAMKEFLEKRRREPRQTGG